MSEQPEQIVHRHVEETKDPQAYIFVLAAGALMIAEIVFGLLNSMNVIHM